MSRHLNVACLQLVPRATMSEALDDAVALADEAVGGGAQMLFLPEFCGGLATQGAAVVPPSAPEAQHPFLAAMQEFAARRGVWINLGSIAVEGPNGRILNRGIMLSDGGQITGRYDKIHLFDIQLSQTEIYRESARVSAGNRAVIHDTKLARIGHTICYDLRFPGLFRRLAQGGAEILCCPAAFTQKTGAAHWHILNRARAIETTRFVISPGMVGPVPGGGETYGHSLIVDPWGVVLGDGGGDGACVVAARIDLDMVGQSAARIPSLANEQAFDLEIVDATDA